MEEGVVNTGPKIDVLRRLRIAFDLMNVVTACSIWNVTDRPRSTPSPLAFDTALAFDRTSCNRHLRQLIASNFLSPTFYPFSGPAISFSKYEALCIRYVYTCYPFVAIVKNIPATFLQHNLQIKQSAYREPKKLQIRLGKKK